MDGGAWWAAVHGVSKSRIRLSDITFSFHFHALEKEMATHSSVLAWRIPGTGEPGGLPSMGSHRVGHDWSNLAAAECPWKLWKGKKKKTKTKPNNKSCLAFGISMIWMDSSTLVEMILSERFSECLVYSASISERTHLNPLPPASSSSGSSAETWFICLPRDWTTDQNTPVSPCPTISPCSW